MHQWYWSYQYVDFVNDDNENIEYDSYIVPEEDLQDGALRMLEVDNRVNTTKLSFIKFIISLNITRKSSSIFVNRKIASKFMNVKTVLYFNREYSKIVSQSEANNSVSKGEEASAITLNEKNKKTPESFGLNYEFIEWLRGFVDGEGTFVISHTTGQYYSFIFQIWLHKDDHKVLNLIQNTLGFGQVLSNDSRNAVYFRVQDIISIKKIIDIFSYYPLNSSKHLNFLVFKEAFELYTNAKSKNDIVSEMNNFINSMNKSRSDYVFNNHKIRITPNWVLGFVEAEGSFYVVKRSYALVFSIAQSSRDSALMEELKNYFTNLCLKSSSSNRKIDGIGLNITKRPNFDLFKLVIEQEQILIDYIIPFFNKLTWRTKKKQSFEYWKIVLELKKLGRNYEEKGLDLLNKISLVMNRLSTDKTEALDLDILSKEITSSLNAPSNLEIREENGVSRIFIKSLKKYKAGVSSKKKIPVVIQDEQGVIIKEFATLKSCADYLGVDPTWVKTLLVKGKAINISKNSDLLKLAYIKRIDESKFSK